MIDLDNILNDLLGAAIVVAVLIAAAVIIKLIASVFRSKEAEDEDVQEQAPASAQSEAGLKLINVDEKSAALIMAIVSHESGIPLSELVFKSIKLV